MKTHKIPAIIVTKNSYKAVVLTSVKFKDIKDILIFRSRLKSSWDNELNNNDYDESVDKFYQRSINADRIKSLEKFISDFLKKSSSDKSALAFPSNVILALDSEDLNFEEEGDLINFNLPNEKRVLIVDGQHRLYAMISLLKKWESDNYNIALRNELLNISLGATIMLNYDTWEQATVFVSVNFKQKPVHKALYYDIFGAFGTESDFQQRADLYLAHELGKALNSKSDSPFFQYVKNLNGKNGFISQSFLVEQLSRHFTPKGNWNFITTSYLNNEDIFEKSKQITNIYTIYLMSIKSSFPNSWPRNISDKGPHIFARTTGVSALIRLLASLEKESRTGTIPKLDPLDFLKASDAELNDFFSRICMKLKNSPDIDTLIGQNSKYLGSGSEGLQSKLHKELIEIIKPE